MAVTIEDFEDKRIHNHLEASKLLGGFSDINGQRKSAPVVYLSEIDLTELQANQRGLLIRQTGGINNPATEIFYDEYNYQISVFGRVGIEDSGIAKGYAKQIRQWLRKNPSNIDNCIMDIQTAGVSGPTITADGRRVYDIGLTVKFNIDRPMFE